MNQQEWVNILCDHVRKTENTQQPPYNWPGKAEGTDAATLYPNVLAELAYDARWLYFMAEGAGVTNEIMAAVLEDGEELDFREIYNLTKHWNSLQAESFLCYVSYMASPRLALLDCASNKGRWRLRKLEQMLMEAEDRKIDFWEHEVPGINQLLTDMRTGRIIPYAKYRVAANIVAKRLQWKHGSEKRIRTSRLTPRREEAQHEDQA